MLAHALQITEARPTPDAGGSRFGLKLEAVGVGHACLSGPARESAL